MADSMNFLPPGGLSNPPQPQPAWRPRPRPQGDRLRELKQLMIDRFAYFRVGIREFSNYDDAGRRPIRQHISIPPHRGPWPGHPRGPDTQTITAIQGPRRGGVLGRLLPRPRDRWARRARGAADGLAGRLARDFRPARYRFRRVLGCGGFGAAFLFEMRDGDGFVLPVVVKADISGGRSRLMAVQKEKENFVAMSGAQHFVQRCVLQTFPLPARPISTLDRLRGLFSVLRVGSNPPGHNDDDSHNDDARTLVEAETTTDCVQAARRVLDRRRDIIIMEYMSRGTLQDLIAKLQGNDRLSNRMLWLMFECLFKACIAMAHPFRFCPADKDPWSELIVAQDENAPESDRLHPTPMVHFDIDPQNALVGDFGLPDDDHGSVPIVKIGDPGLSEFVDWRFRRDERKLWAQRVCGKPDFFTPEQFTDEWDYEAARGPDELAREETAGNYQWWSNLFQVGLVMWCLITHCSPPDPPAASPYSYPAEDGSNATVDGFSYGMILYSAEFGAYDRRLRHLVARCLDHNPMDRPRMRYLEQVIAANVGRVDLRGRESDEELMRNARRIFGEPP